MAEVNLSSGTEASGGLTDLTKKQQEMSFARSPMNNQAVNLSDKKGTPNGILSGKQATDTQQATQGVGALASQTRTVAGQDSPQMAGLRANLGTFATKLQGAINQYLQGGPTSNINAQNAAGSSPVYNEKTESWSAPEIDVTAGLGGVLDEKLAQKDAVGEASSVFRENSFEKVLERFADTNGDGVLDANEQAFLSQSFGISNALRRLEQLDPYSPEAEALRMQLQYQDREGLVSGLQAAMDKYEDVSGMKIAGPEGEDKSLEDLINMSSSEVLSELEKATESGAGLFSGDVATSLKSQFDEAARQYTGAAQEDATVMQSIRDTTDSWLKEYEDSLEASRDQINEMFLGASQGIVQDLEKLKAAAALKGEDTKWVDQAKQWFADLQTGIKNGSRNFAEVVQQLLASDIGMAPEAKKALEKWLGDAVGEEASGKGEIAKLLQQVSDKGYALTKDEFGNTKRVMFTSSDKQQIAGILADEELSTAEKQEAIQNIIQDRSGGLGKDLKKDTEYVSDLIKDGSFKTAVSSFREAMTNSLASFKNSAVKDVYNKIIESGVDPATLGGQGMEDTITQRVNDQLQAINTSADAAFARVEEVKNTAKRDQEEITALLSNFKQLNANGVKNVKDAVQGAMAARMPQYAAAIKDTLAKAGVVLSPGELQDRATVYSFLAYMKSARGTPLYTLMATQFGGTFENLVNNPRLVFKQTKEDMNNFEIAKIMSIQIPYERVFADTEAYRQLQSKQGELEKKLIEAKSVTTAASMAGLNIKSSLMQAIVGLKQVGTATPLQMFMAAKTGDDKLLGPKFGNFKPEDFSKMGYEVSYTEDATQAIDFDIGYTPVEVKDNQTAGELGSPVFVKPVTAANGNTVVPTRDIRGKGVPNNSTFTYYKAEMNDGKVIVVPVPRGANPADYLGSSTGVYNSSGIKSFDEEPTAAIPGYESVMNINRTAPTLQPAQTVVPSHMTEQNEIVDAITAPGEVGVTPDPKTGEKKAETIEMVPKLESPTPSKNTPRVKFEGNRGDKEGSGGRGSGSDGQRDRPDRRR